MQVSVIIINYNTFTYTCNCIQSVIEKTKDIDYEIILVDNASVECNSDLFQEKFPNIKLIKSAENIGFAGGNNLGIARAIGQYILLLNSDTVLIENSIKFIYEKCKTISDLGAATIKLIYPDGTIQPCAKKFPSVLAHFLEASRLHKIFKKTYQQKTNQYNYNVDFKCDWIWGTFFFFEKKKLTITNGKLSCTYFMYSEDVEWCYNFKKAGLNNYYFSKSKLIHLLGKSSPDIYKKELIEKNHLNFIKSNYGLVPFIIESLIKKMVKLKLVLIKDKE